MTAYPPLPGVFAVPDRLRLTWAQAMTHSLLVALWSHPELAERYAQPELTGPTHSSRSEDVFPQVRTDVPPRPRPIERYGKAPACMCLYGLRRVPGVPGMFPLDPFHEGWHKGVWAFRVHPKCPHHGDQR